MQQLWENLAALLKVKTLVTLAVTGVFAALALAGRLQPDVVMSVVTMVMAFYFGTQDGKRGRAQSGAQGDAASVQTGAADAQGDAAGADGAAAAAARTGKAQ